MLPRRPRQRAFSLVELLIAFFVLLIGILAILVLFPLGLRESNTMVDSSMASFIARNARASMEVQTFNYHGDGQAKLGYGTASLIQARYGPKGSSGYLNNFPVMFPWDVLGNNDDCSTFPLSQRLVDPDTSQRDRVLDASKSQYSWDARFTIGGGPGLTPPPGFTFASDADWQAQYFYWFSQYFKYYAVQISVYRNYKQIPIGGGTIWVRTAPKPGGGSFDTNDPNRLLYSELVVSGQPNPDIIVGTAIRIRDDKSDWYRITAVGFQGGTWTFRLDRPYAGLNIGPNAEISASKNDVIATNTLIESFTTMLGSQLDDVNTGTVTFP